MKIGCFYSPQLKQNIISNFSNKISFGELDDCDCSYLGKRRQKDDEYYYEQDRINAKYNKQRSEWFRDCDDLEFSSEVMWKHLDNIERARRNELSCLDDNY